MIVESTVERSIGQVVRLRKFAEGASEVVVAKVIRAATEKEYVASCLADPSCPPENRSLMVVENRTDRWWYEVSAD